MIALKTKTKTKMIFITKISLLSLPSIPWIH